MNERRENLGFSIFSLHNSDHRLVKPVKVDPLKDFIPIAFGIIGLFLLFCSLASHAEPLTLQNAPMEFRVNNIEVQKQVNLQLADKLKVGSLPGDMQNPRWQAGFKTLEFKGGDWILQGASAHILIDGWKMQSNMMRSGFGLDVECRGIDLAFLPGQVILPMPTQMQLDIRTGGGKLELAPRWDMKAWLDSVLRPHFSGAALSRSLNLNANCPGQLATFGRDVLQVKLQDLPSKDPELYQKLSSGAQDAIQNVFKNALASVPSGLDFDGSLGLWRQSDGSFLIVPSDQKADFLSYEARRLIAPLPTNAPAAQAILSPAALSRFALLGMTAVAATNGGAYENGRIIFRLPNKFTAKQFSPYILELASESPGAPVSVQLSMPAVDGDHPNPHLRPWISDDGYAAGFDLDATLVFDFVDPASQKVLASRTVSAEMVFNDEPSADGGGITWSYDSGHWIPESSKLGASSTELGVTLDWLLNSDSIKDFLRKEISQSLTWSQFGAIKFHRVGRGGDDMRRPKGGWYAEALVIDVTLAHQPSF